MIHRDLFDLRTGPRCFKLNNQNYPKIDIPRPPSVSFNMIQFVKIRRELSSVKVLVAGELLKANKINSQTGP